MNHYDFDKTNDNQDYDRTRQVQRIKSRRASLNNHLPVRAPARGIEADDIRVSVLPRLYDEGFFWQGDGGVELAT